MNRKQVNLEANKIYSIRVERRTDNSTRCEHEGLFFNVCNKFAMEINDKELKIRGQFLSYAIQHGGRHDFTDVNLIDRKINKPTSNNLIRLNLDNVLKGEAPDMQDKTERETPAINKKAYEIVDLKNNRRYENNNDSEDNPDFDALKAYDIELAKLMKRLEEGKEKKETTREEWASDEREITRKEWAFAERKITRQVATPEQKQKEEIMIDREEIMIAREDVPFREVE